MKLPRAASPAVATGSMVTASTTVTPTATVWRSRGSRGAWYGLVSRCAMPRQIGSRTITSNLCRLRIAASGPSNSVRISGASGLDTSLT